jgi:hypothetical protein
LTGADQIKEDNMKRYILMILSGIALDRKNSSPGIPMRTQPQGAKVLIREEGEKASEMNISPALSHIKCNKSYTVTIKLGVFKTMIDVYRKCLEKGALKNLVGAALDFLTEDTKLYYKSILGEIKSDDLPKKAVMRFFLKGGDEVKQEFPLVWARHVKNWYNPGDALGLITA